MILNNIKQLFSLVRKVKCRKNPTTLVLKIKYVNSLFFPLQHFSSYDDWGLNRLQHILSGNLKGHRYFSGQTDVL